MLKHVIARNRNCTFHVVALVSYLPVTYPQRKNPHARGPLVTYKKEVAARIGIGGLGR